MQRCHLKEMFLKKWTVNSTLLPVVYIYIKKTWTHAFPKLSQIGSDIRDELVPTKQSSTGIEYTRLTHAFPNVLQIGSERRNGFVPANSLK